MCPMCEAHVNDALRAAISAKSVSSSHKNGESVILSDAALDEATVRAAVEKTGYTVISVVSGEYEKKKRFFGLF